MNIFKIYHASLQTQSFIPLVLCGSTEETRRGAGRSKKRPKSANNTLTHNNRTFSTISVDERFVRSPYLQVLRVCYHGYWCENLEFGHLLLPSKIPPV